MWFLHLVTVFIHPTMVFFCCLLVFVDWRTRSGSEDAQTAFSNLGELPRGPPGTGRLTGSSAPAGELGLEVFSVGWPWEKQEDSSHVHPQRNGERLTPGHQHRRAQPSPFPCSAGVHRLPPQTGCVSVCPSVRPSVMTCRAFPSTILQVMTLVSARCRSPGF